MMEIFGSFWRVGSWWLLLLWLITGLVVVSSGGCVKSGEGDTFEQKQAAATQREQAAEQLMRELGIEGYAYCELGPGMAGQFLGAVWDTGINVRAFLKANPREAAQYAAGMKLIDEKMRGGMSWQEAATEAAAEVKSSGAAAAPLEPSVTESTAAHE